MYQTERSEFTWVFLKIYCVVLLICDRRVLTMHHLFRLILCLYSIHNKRIKFYAGKAGRFIPDSLNHLPWILVQKDGDWDRLLSVPIDSWCCAHDQLAKIPPHNPTRTSTACEIELFIQNCCCICYCVDEHWDSILFWERKKELLFLAKHEWFISASLTAKQTWRP